MTLSSTSISFAYQQLRESLGDHHELVDKLLLQLEKDPTLINKWQRLNPILEGEYQDFHVTVSVANDGHLGEQ